MNKIKHFYDVAYKAPMGMVFKKSPLNIRLLVLCSKVPYKESPSPSNITFPVSLLIAASAASDIESSYSYQLSVS